MYIGCHDGSCRTSDSLFEGNYIHHTRGTSDGGNDGIEIKAGSYGNIVRNNVIANNNNQGLQFNGDLSMGGTGIVTGALVENNIIRNSGSNGMNCDGLQNSRIQNDLI